MGIITNPLQQGLPSDDLRHAYEHWHSLQGEHGLARHRNLDPVALVKLLPMINLVDVVWNGNSRRFRHRLVGTGLVGYFRVDSTGRWFDEIYRPDHLRRQLPAYERAVCDQTPSLDLVTVAMEEQTLATDLAYWRLILPMTRAGDGVDLLFLIFEPVSTNPKCPTPLPLYHQSNVLA